MIWIIQMYHQPRGWPSGAWLGCTEHGDGVPQDYKTTVK